MSDVHRSEHLTLFPVLKVYSGSGSPDLESLGIVAKGLQMHGDIFLST